MEREKELVIEGIRNLHPEIDWPTPIEDCVWVGRRDKVFLEDHKAIRDAQSGAVYAITSNKYNLVRHEEVIQIMYEALNRPEMAIYGKPEVEIMILADGGKMKAKVKFPEVTYEIRKQDFINPTINWMNSYDLGWKVRQLFGAFRLVCSNGMVVGKTFSKFVKRHMPSLKVKDMTVQLISGMNSLADQAELWKKLGDIKVTQEKYDQIFVDLGVSEKRKAEIEAIPEASTRLLLPDAVKQDTLDAWTMYNVLSQFSTHSLVSEVARTDFDENLAHIFERRILH